MKRRNLLSGAAVVGLLLTAPVALANSGGIIDYARPGVGCNCHDQSPTTIRPLLFLFGLPEEEGFVPGCSYELTVHVLGTADLIPAYAGFNLAATGGRLEVTDPTALVLNRTQCAYREFFELCDPDSPFGDPCAPENCDAEIEAQATHSNRGPLGPGVPPFGRTSWDLLWTAPEEAADVTFYLAGNMVNGTTTDGGDNWSVHPTGWTVQAAQGGSCP